MVRETLCVSCYHVLVSSYPFGISGLILATSSFEVIEWRLGMEKKTKAPKRLSVIRWSSDFERNIHVLRVKKALWFVWPVSDLEAVLWKQDQVEPRHNHDLIIVEWKEILFFKRFVWSMSLAFEALHAFSRLRGILLLEEPLSQRDFIQSKAAEWI